MRAEKVLSAGVLAACLAAALPAAAQALPAGWRLQGEATMRFLGMAVYDATLAVPPAFSADAWAAQPLALALRYRRNLRGAAIAERSLHEMRRGGAIDEASAARWLAFMTSAFPDVRSGDRIVGRWSPASGTVSVQVNDGPAQELVDAEFGPRFFGIWLAPHTSEPGMRARLLGAS
jgi:Chalcone isomerase-like